MPYIKVKTNRFDNYENDIEKCLKKINALSREFSSIGNNLDWDVKKARQIHRQIQVILYDDLYSITQAMENIRQFWTYALEEYKKVDCTIDKLFDNIPLTEIQQQQKRQKIVDNIKIGLAVVLGITALAASALAGPAVILTVSAISSITTTTVDHLGQAYVENEEVKIQDWGEYGKDILVNSIVDVGLSSAGTMIGGITGGYVDDAFKGMQTTLSRAGAKAVSGTVSGITSEIIIGSMERSTKAIGDGIYDSVINGEGFLDANTRISNEINDAIWDKEAIVNDLATGIGKGVAGGVETIVDESLGSTVLQTDLYSTNTKKRIGANAILGAADKTVSGIVKRGTEEIVTGAINGDLKFDTVIDAALDSKKIVKDAVSSSVKQGIKGQKTSSFVEGMSEYSIDSKTGATVKNDSSDKIRYTDSTGYASAMSADDARQYNKFLSQDNET